MARISIVSTEELLATSNEYTRKQRIDEMNRFGMGGQGLVLPLDQDTNAFLWQGKIDDRDEAPVLAAVTTESFSEQLANTKCWWVGVLACGGPESEEITASEILDVAVSGQYDLLDAMGKLASLMPPKVQTQ